MDEKKAAVLDGPPRSSLDRSPASIAEGHIIDDNDEEVVVGWRSWMAAISGASCVYSGYYTGLLLGATAPFIVKTFGEASVASWIPNEYTIVTAALAGLTGACADHIGRKNILIGGILIAFVGAIMMAAAQNMATVLAGAAMQAGLFVSPRPVNCELTESLC